jgi:putative transposase
MLRTGATYHITAKADHGNMKFDSKTDKELMLAVFRDAKTKYLFEVLNFCIMNNHIHLLIKPAKDVSLSRIMQWILSVFAMRWNRLHGTNGHVWGQRFFSRIIENFRDWLRTFLYIDENPVQAHLVEQPWQWQYGGVWHHRMCIPDIVEDMDTIITGLCPNHMRLALMN